MQAVRSRHSARAARHATADRAEVIATRLRKLEAGRGRKAPIYAADPRVIAWVTAGLSDPDLKEAYELATADHTGMLTAGILSRYINEVMAEAMA